MTNITLFGCGAVGSQLVMHLASSDIHFTLVDDDRITEDNILTSAYSREQINIDKSLALSILIYRKVHTPTNHYNETLTYKNYLKFVKDSNLVIDCFDNVEARLITCQVLAPATLHVGVSREGTGSITWDNVYVPFSGAPRGEDTFCTHLAGRNIIRLTACLAASIVEKFITTGEKESIIVTNRLTIIK